VKHTETVEGYRAGEKGAGRTVDGVVSFKYNIFRSKMPM
jgi:hypothetical protein